MLSTKQLRVPEGTNQRLRSSRDQLALADLCIKSSHQLILKTGAALELRDNVDDVSSAASDTGSRQRGGDVLPSKGFLDSWKQIAVFLQRGVRTVQRWEREEGLPVHRHRHSMGGTVFALASEIQKWLKSRAADECAETPAMPKPQLIPVPPFFVCEDLAERCEAARVRAERARGKFELVS